MASFVSVIQGTLFAALQCGVLTVVLQEFLTPQFGIDTPLISRLLLFHFCATFLLGMALSEHLHSRKELVNNNGALVSAVVIRDGSIGQWIMALTFLYFTELLMIFSRESMMFVIPLLVCVHVFALAAARKTPVEQSMFSTPIGALVAMMAVISMTVNAPVIQDISTWFAELFGFKAVPLPTSYLAGNGSIFAKPKAIISIITGVTAAFVLIPSS